MENNIFEQDSLFRTYMKLSLPVVLGCVATIIYNMADTFFIALTGNTELIAAVSLCAPVFSIMMAFGNILGHGGSSLISRLFGSNNIKETRHVSSFCFYISIVIGAVIGVLMLLFAGPFLSLLGANEETIVYARDYYKWLAYGAPLIIPTFAPLNQLRCEGLSGVSMLCNVAGLVLNIILDPILIFTFGMGAAGAAIATVLGYVLSDILYVLAVVKKSRIMSMSIFDFKVSAGEIRQIFSVGVSAAITNWMTSIYLIIINHFLLPYGNDQIAAMGIVQKITSIIIMLLVGFSFGASPIFGYFYGQHNKAKLLELFRLVMNFIAILGAVLCLIIFITASPLIRMFLSDPSLIETGALMLRLQVITMTTAGVIIVITILFQSAGMGMIASLISVCRQGIIFLISIFIMSAFFGYMGILTAQIAADIISTVIAFLCFYRFYMPKLKAM